MSDLDNRIDRLALVYLKEHYDIKTMSPKEFLEKSMRSVKRFLMPIKVLVNLHSLIHMNSELMVSMSG